MEALASAATTVLPMWQAQSQHGDEVRVNNELHAKAIYQAEDFHQEEQEFARILHRKSRDLQRELHYSSMSHETEIARREATRDVWSQRNQLVQTLMVVDTLMFSCAFAIVVQGDPPQNTPTWLIRIYAVCLALSLVLLFSSIWLSLKMQTRMSQYDMHNPATKYVCGKTHTNFNDYYECHCGRISRGAFFLFYVGAGATIADAAIFAVTQLHYRLGNMAGVVLVLVIAAIAIFVPAFGRYIWPATTEAKRAGAARTPYFEVGEKEAEEVVQGSAEEEAEDSRRFTSS